MRLECDQIFSRRQLQKDLRRTTKLNYYNEYASAKTYFTQVLFNMILGYDTH